MSVGPTPRSRTPGVDDEGQDPGERVVVLEARHHVDGDEAEDLAGILGDDHLPVAATRTARSARRCRSAAG